MEKENKYIKLREDFDKKIHFFRIVTRYDSLTPSEDPEVMNQYIKLCEMHNSLPDDLRNHKQMSKMQKIMVEDALRLGNLKNKYWTLGEVENDSK